MNADQQVINMVNRKHENEKKQMMLQRQQRLRQAKAWRRIYRLIVKLELALIAISLFIIAAGNGWVTVWLSVIGAVICFTAASVLVGVEIGKNEKENAR